MVTRLKFTQKNILVSKDINYVVTVHCILIFENT